MDLTLNIIPAPIPDICESAHERLAPPSVIYREHSPLLQQPKITIIRLPCNNTHHRAPTSTNPKIETNSQHQALHTPLASSFKQPSHAPPSTSKLVSFPRKRFPASQKPSPLTTSSDRPSLPTKIPTSSNHASNPHIHNTCAKQQKTQTIHSSHSDSSFSSCISDPSTTRRLRVPPTTPASSCSTPSITRKSSMSEQAAETVRVMDWAIALVKSAEKRVREQERAAYEEEAFVLRLRRWEAEMKIRKMEEDEEEEEEIDVEAHGTDDCLNREMLWKYEQSGMRRCKKLIRDKQQRCWRGLGVALER